MDKETAKGEDEEKNSQEAPETFSKKSAMMALLASLGFSWLSTGSGGCFLECEGWENVGKCADRPRGQKNCWSWMARLEKHREKMLGKTLGGSEICLQSRNFGIGWDVGQKTENESMHLLPE